MLIGVPSCSDSVSDLDWSHSVLAGLYKKRTMMDAPGFASPIRNYQQNLSKMRESNDPNASESSNLYMCSLGVVDLDLTVCPGRVRPKGI